jgi:hypothetical protein
VSKPKKTTNQFIQRSKKTHGDFYDYLNVEYKSAHSKVKIICPKHGLFEQTPNNHQRGQGCKKCGKEKTGKKLSLSPQSFLQKAKEKHGDKYNYSKTVYKNTKSDIIILCKEHGEFSQSASNHLQGSGCPKCGIESCIKEKRKSLNFVIEEFKKVHADKINKYNFSESEYIKSNEKIRIFCKDHGEFWITPNNLLGGHKCKKCAFKDLKEETKGSRTKNFIKKSILLYGHKYNYNKINYIDSISKIDIFCETCKKYFKQTPSNHINGYGCYRCCLKESLLESFIEKFLLKLNISFSKNDRNVLEGKELDFFIPSHNIAIECNGIYWHSELMGKNKGYHLNKTEECKKKNIKLIHIFESEIKKAPKKVLSRLKSILNVNKYKFFARKCEIQKIDKKTKGNFLNKYHIQNNDRSSIFLGLFYKKRLVSVMTFCKNRKALGKKHEEGEYELSRFASSFNFNVIGGASKLLSNFIKEYSPKKITSYADMRWSTGNLYYKIGFKLIKKSLPNYWYFSKKDSMNLKHRFGFRKGILEKRLDTFDKNKTEWENMKLNGYNRIWDCGNFVFEYKNN